MKLDELAPETLEKIHTYRWDRIFAGFLAICDKVPGEEWFIAIVYHEWFIIENA